MKTVIMIIMAVVLNVVSVCANDIIPVNTPNLEDISVPKEGIWVMDIYTGRVYENNIIDAYFNECIGVLRVLSINEEGTSTIINEYVYDRVKVFNENGECSVLLDGNFNCK